MKAQENAGFRDATRVITSFLSVYEKRVLLYLAARMPRFVTSDHLTALGLVAMLGTGIAFWASRTYPTALIGVVACLAVNWFGDSLDGTLARVRKCERPRYGYYVDHVSDMFGTLFLFSGLAMSGYMTPVIAVGLLIAYLMMSIEIYLAAQVLGEFRITYWMVGPTELRILLAAGAMALLVRPSVVIFGHTWLLFDVGGVIGIVGLMVLLIRTCVQHAQALEGV